MRIYVSNLAAETTHAELRTAFASYGEVTRVGLAKDSPSGKSKVSGLVEMSNESEATAAIAKLNGGQIGDRTIRARFARPDAKQQ